MAAVVGVDGGTIHLAAGFPDWEACAAALAPPHLIGTPADDMEQRVRAMHPDWPESGIAGTLANMEVRADGTVAPWLTRERHMAVLRGLWEHDPAQAYPRVAIPAILAPARDDRADQARAAMQARQVEAALAALPDGRVAWFDGADHDIHAQRPAEVARLLLGLEPR
jgi:pimeloyl-ACP methyl ester carboxylesterase